MARKGEVSILIKIRDAGSAALASIGAKLRGFATSAKAYLTSVNGMLAGVTAGLTAAGIASFVVRSTMEFQKFAAQLKVFTGSSAGAANAMEELKKLAMELPFDLAQITDAFITLRSGGIEPTDKLMRAMGDIASGAGKDILQLAQAVRNGTMGEMEMLKQFGISMLVQGDQLKASFGGQAKLIGRDAASVVAYLEELAQLEFAGAAAERMDTLEGKMSNLSDKAWNLAVVIGMKGGVVEALGEAADSASNLADMLTRNETVLTHWSRMLVSTMQFVGSVVWTALVVPFDAVMMSIGLVLASIFQLGAGIMSVFQLVGKAVTKITGDDALEKFLDPSYLQGLANSTLAFTERRAQGAVQQVTQALPERLANLAVAIEGERIGEGGFAKPAARKTPPPSAVESVDDYNKRQREIAAARMKREEQQATDTTRRRDVSEDERTRRTIDRGAGVEEALAGRGPGVPAPPNAFGAMMAGPGRSSDPMQRQADQTAAMAALNAEIQKTIDGLAIATESGVAFGPRLGASILTAVGEVQTLEQQLLQLGTTGLQTFTDGFLGAFAQLHEGWASLGQAMVAAVRGAVSEMAMQQARYYSTKALAALGEALLNPLGAAKSLAAAAKFTAAAAGFAALAGVAGSAGAGGGGGGGGGSGVTRHRANAGLDNVTGAPVTLVLNGDRFDVNDPRTQDEFRSMLERLSGRSVEIRRR